jgi:hypothetical protein
MCILKGKKINNRIVFVFYTLPFKSQSSFSIIHCDLYLSYSGKSEFTKYFEAIHQERQKVDEQRQKHG